MMIRTSRFGAGAKAWIACMLLTISPICAGIAGARVSVGENILLNGRLEADQLPFPQYWNAREGTVRYLRDGGPDGLAAIRIAPGRRTEVGVSQMGLQTASNGLYRIRLRYRAQDAAFDKCQIGIAVGRWELFDGIDLPGGTCGWRTIEGTVKAIDYPKANTHFLVFYTIGLSSGLVEFADVQLSPADERTARQTSTSSLVAAARTIRLVPIAPRLDEIHAGERTVEFRFFGTMPDGVSEGDCVAVFDFGNAGMVELPIRRDPIRLAVPVGTSGGDMTAKVVVKSTGEELFRRVFPYGFKAALRTPVAGRRLNGLCTEICRKKLLPGRHALSIGCERRAWHYISAPGVVSLDGKVIVDGTFPRHETFRELGPGDHDLDLDLPDGGEVIVRRVSEIFNFCSGVNNPIAGYGVFDWEFTKRHVVGAVTTHNCPRLKSQNDELKRLGGLVLWQFKSSNIASGDDFIGRAEKSWGLRPGTNYDGVTADEQYLAQSDMMTRFADGLWRMHGNACTREKRIYSWFVGNPAVDGVDHDALAAAVNATEGKGKALYEMYFPTRETETEARAYIAARMHETLTKYDRFCPGILPRLGFVFGNFNTTTFITLWSHPQVDYKYYLDMQWNALANDPAFDGIGATGYWGSHDADEELHRWSFLLARHYVVEGRTDMLSAAYGLKYNGLVADGDFAEGLGRWTASPGVEPMTIEGLGGLSQSRWGGNDGNGDTCAAFPVKAADTASSVSQRLRGLVPGRWYRLTFCSFNVADMVARRTDKYLHGVIADIGQGAVRDPSRSWTDFENSARGSQNGGAARANLHVVTFRATADETVLAISDAKAKAGDRLGVNFVSVNPYIPVAGE